MEFSDRVGELANFWELHWKSASWAYRACRKSKNETAQVLRDLCWIDALSDRRGVWNLPKVNINAPQGIRERRPISESLLPVEKVIEKQYKKEQTGKNSSNEHTPTEAIRGQNPFPAPKGGSDQRGFIGKCDQ